MSRIPDPTLALQKKWYGSVAERFSMHISDDIAIISELESEKGPGDRGSYFMIQVMSTEVNRLGERNREPVLGFAGFAADANVDRLWTYTDYYIHYQGKASLPVQARLECWAYDFSPPEEGGE